MKQPASVEGLAFCPMIQRGCVGDACSWWVEITGVDDDGQVHLDKSCSIAWLPILGREQLIETVRGTATQDKVANETRILSSVVSTGLQDQKALGNDR